MFVQELRQAVHGWSRRPLAAVAAVATLALAIGANTAIFSVLEAVLVRPAPIAEADRLVRVSETNPKRGVERNVINPGNLIRWRERARTLTQIAGFIVFPTNVSGIGEPERLRSGIVTGDFFPLFRARAAVGRLLAPADALETAPDVCVLSHELFRRWGSDGGLVGRMLRVNGTPTMIVGVAPEAFPAPEAADLWIPLALGERHRDSGGRYLTGLARLAPGATLESADAELVGIAAALERERPDVDAGWSAVVEPYSGPLIAQLRSPLAALAAAVGVVLLIGCANVAGLLLARLAEREREIAVRRALGASRWQLARQFFAESLVIAGAGAAAGIVLARGGVALLVAWAPLELPPWVAVGLDAGALAFAVGAALAAAALTALVPVLASGRDAESLRSASVVAPRARLARVLVVAEIALSLVLLSSAALLTRSLVRLAGVDPGFRASRLVAMDLTLPGRNPAYQDEAKVVALFAEAERRIAALPGVEAAGAISWAPLSGMGSATSFVALDREAPKKGEEPVADIRIVSPGALATLGVPLVAGRALDARDAADRPLAILVNRSTARLLWPSADAVGRRLRIRWGGDEGVEAEIVGVVGDVHLSALEETPRPAIYFASAQQPLNFMTLIARTSLPPGSVATAARRAIAGLDPELPLAEVRSMRDVVARSLGQPRFTAALLASLAGLALALAAIGLYALVARTVARRRREFGVRLALGGTGLGLVRLVLGSGSRLLAAGLALGLLGALAASRLLTSLLFETAPTDPLALAAGVVTLTLVTWLACLVPAVSAARLDPARALRED
ncbi:MAG: ADOP family duplicated permease [Thermoanaerobaculia bacterium]